VIAGVCDPCAIETLVPPTAQLPSVTPLQLGLGRLTVTGSAELELVFWITTLCVFVVPGLTDALLTAGEMAIL
jgi:hypothetical protein